ncbi:hypothetical protein [Streptosporangium sp. G12]
MGLLVGEPELVMDATNPAPTARRRSRVVAVDVGSVRRNFAWAALDLPARKPVGAGGSHPEGAARVVLEAVAAGLPVALGFEAPLVVPVSPVGVPDGWATLGRARQGESVDGCSRPWSAGPGSGALATGLVQLAWVLERVAAGAPGLRCTTNAERWLVADAELFVWEAFVSGAGKPAPGGVSQHAADAAAAADTFAERAAAGNLVASDVTCAPESSFNLAAAAALYAGMTIDPGEVHSPLHVYRTRSAAPSRLV